MKMLQGVDFMGSVSADDWPISQDKVDCYALAQRFLEWAQDLADQGRDGMAEKLIALTYDAFDMGLGCCTLIHPTELN